MNDLQIAQSYQSKAAFCEKEGKEFGLSLLSYINIMRASKCKYTRAKIRRGAKGGDKLTIDRIDNKKGYIKGNVVACSLAANRFKAFLEDPDRSLSIQDIEKIIKVYKDVHYS